MSEFPLIKRAYVAWANIKIALTSLTGQAFLTRDFTAFDWDDSVEVNKQPGTGVMHVGRAIGKYDANASMTMYLDAAMAFQEALLANAPTLVEAPFDAMISWEPLNGAGRIFTAKVVGALITNRSMKNAPGPDGAVMEMPLSVDRVEPIAPSGKVLRLV